MITQRIYNASDLGSAAEVLRQGGLVAVPTETVYGLCANGLDAAAVAALYEIKGRPEVKPLALMVPDAGAMELYAHDVPTAARALADCFWPGPLTIILPAREDVVPSIVRAGGSTIGLRCPDSPLTLELLRQVELPLAGPSANPSGAPSPKNADTVLSYFNGRIPAVIDGGECAVGTESTILSMAQKPYRILRQGGLAEKEIRAALAGALTVIGVTGGTGTGKTTVMSILAEEGALTLDCDEIYHELLRGESETAREMLAGLRGCFGDAVFNGKELNRKALAAVVFSDDGALASLNEITHKYVVLEVRRRLEDFAMAGGTAAVVDAIALLESGLAELCDATVGVIAPEETRLARIMEREDITRDYALQRIRAQKDEEYFLRNCDIVVDNGGSPEELEEKCRQLRRKLMEEE